MISEKHRVLYSKSKILARVKELAEEAKVALRNIRRDGNKTADAAEKDKSLSEDDRDEVKKEIQDLIKQYESRVNEVARTREKEVLEE